MFIRSSFKMLLEFADVICRKFHMGLCFFQRWGRGKSVIITVNGYLDGDSERHPASANQVCTLLYCSFKYCSYVVAFILFFRQNKSATGEAMPKGEMDCIVRLKYHLLFWRLWVWNWSNWKNWSIGNIGFEPVSEVWNKYRIMF